MKMGNGITAWTSLPYLLSANFNVFADVIQAGMKSGVAESMGATWTDLGQRGSETQILSLVIWVMGLPRPEPTPPAKIFRSVAW
jgi:hypothetical protein